jgi:hypothetical protein
VGIPVGNAFYGTNGYDVHTISYREFVKKAATFEYLQEGKNRLKIR